MKIDAAARAQFWPALPFADWSQTARTLHLWTQIVGKVRLGSTPWINHSWHVTLYVTSRGLTTSPIPHGLRTFEILFDFISHELRILVSTGEIEVIPLRPQSVAAFYRQVTAALTKLQLPAAINPLANELAETIHLNDDETDRAYDRECANRFWRILVQADRVLTAFRSEFCGKCSPVHFFWGSFDLAVTRFSGRPAPPHPGGIPHLPDAVTREAYSQEVSSVGFWPGNEQMPTPIFYSYAYPEPAGFSDAKVTPAAAKYDSNLHEFTLPYDAVRAADSPDDMLLEFARSTYDQASILGKWDRVGLEEKKP